MKRLASIALVCMFAWGTLQAQKGKHGSKTVVGTEIVNEYSNLAADASAGDVSISVSSSLLNDNGRFSGNLEEGDLIMIIQIQGATLFPGSGFNPGKMVEWGRIDAYNNCGNNEYAEVASVPNANTIELSCGLKNDYTAAGNVLIVRVPRYTDLTVPGGTTITGDAWDGSVGGIVAIEVDGDADIDGNINMDEKGFRGTASTNNPGKIDGARWEFANTDQRVGGLKGEGVGGYHTEYNALNGEYGMGSAGNGGGGGGSVDAGGGGGANAGDPSNWTGFGVPSTSTASWANAWELEIVGLSTSSSSGGGRGGYSRCSNTVDPLTNAPNDYGPWGADGRRDDACGYGGRPLDYTTGKLFLGGGGGQGHGSDRDASAGGNGGGMILLTVGNNITGSGTISSIGQDGEDNANANGFASAIDGGGGAGAGGTIVLNTVGTISTLTINAVGGEGGTCTQNSFANPDENSGPGGGGGGGYVKVSSAGPTIDVSGGANGIANSVTMAAFPPNGATYGGVGITEVVAYTEPSLTVGHDTICIGGTANLTATGNNLPGGAVITWYDSYSNGSVLGTGTTYNDAGITTDTMFFVGICPGTTKDTVYVKVTNGANGDVVNDTVNACAGVGVQMEATGGATYTWWPTTGLDNANIADPTVTIASSDMYYVEITTAGGCSDTDSVYVNISNNLTVNLGADQTICYGDSVTLTASGGTIYTWTPNANISSTSTPSVDVYPTDTTTYYVTVDDGSGCTGEDSIKVNVLPQIEVVSPGNQDLCIDQVANLSMSHTGGSGGSVTYSWDEGAFVGANQSFSWNASTSMEIKVTDDTYGCADSLTLLINIRTFNLDFTYSDTCLGSATNFIATESASGTLVSNAWKFNGPNTGVGTTISHTYPNDGVNTATFYATDDLGCVDSVEKSFTIVQIPNTTIVFAPDTICAGQSINYTNNYAGISGASFDWDFGDGTSDNSLNGAHEYSNSGVYYIELEITDSNGCANTDMDSVLVVDGPVPNFTMPTEGKIGETVTLTNTTTGAQVYNWYVDPAVLHDDATNTTLSLDSVGEICVLLHAISQAGCSDTVSHCITVLGEEILVPNVFTPNGDDFNDFLEIFNIEGKQVKLSILNRWGVEVYASNEYQNDWDGKDKNGNDVAAGTYFYVIVDETGEAPVQLNGFISIAR